MARPPIHGSEGDAGGLIVGNRLMVPERGSAHIYDPVSDDWSTLLLPGIGTEWDMVWTGEEVLMWGVPLCCVENGARVDAWRWTPPD